VLWDPHKRLTISARSHHQNTDYNLYEGWEVTGAPRTVLSRGRVLVDNDQWQGQQGAGKFVARRGVGK
jgi:dihydropyrimidinase